MPDLIKLNPEFVRMHDNVIMCESADSKSIIVFDAITGQQVTAVQDSNMKSSQSIFFLIKG